MNEQYNVRRFVEEMLIPDLKKMIDLRLHYYAFSVMCQAIELLGSVFDQGALSDSGQSANRFDNALTHLFRDKRYRSWKAAFFSMLRGPLIHQLRPGDEFCLSSEIKDGIDRKNHLEREKSGRVILLIEQFLDDFLDAYASFVRHLSTRRDLDHAKVESVFIEVSTISPPTPTTQWDAGNQQVLTIYPSVTGKAIP